MKKLFLLIGVTFMVLCASLVSCATTGRVKYIHDPSVPVEQTARISSSGIGEIIGYNGTAVNWTPPGTRLTKISTFIQIPAGNAILEWNIKAFGHNAEGYDTFTTGNNLLFAYNFRPQKKYFFLVGFKDGKSGLNVFAYNLDEKIKLTSGFGAHFDAFAPFLNVRDTNERMILE